MEVWVSIILYDHLYDSYKALERLMKYMSRFGFNDRVIKYSRSKLQCHTSVVTYRFPANDLLDQKYYIVSVHDNS